jgi:hypothetical protein
LRWDLCGRKRKIFYHSNRINAKKKPLIWGKKEATPPIYGGMA